LLRSIQPVLCRLL